MFEQDTLDAEVGVLLGQQVQITHFATIVTKSHAARIKRHEKHTDTHIHIHTHPACASER